MPAQSKNIKFVLVAILMLLLFNYPLLSTANKPIRIAGLPLLYIYIGIVWLLAITILYFTANNNRRN